MSSAAALLDFIAQSPSPWHCVAEAARRLRADGFAEHPASAPPRPLNPGDGGFLREGGTLIAWRMGGQSPAEAGFRILGAHTDSPNLRLKPRAEYTREGYLQWGVEVYGGALLHTWTDRDLVALRGDAGIETRLLRIERPIARVPNLAIHLQRELKTEGLKLDRQKHLPPVVALADEDAGSGAVLTALLADTLAIDPARILGFDLGLHDLQPPVLGGLHEEFIFAPRLDNQASCFVALQALLSLDAVPAPTSVVVLFDHEEVGSTSSRGACGALRRRGSRRALSLIHI